MTCECSICGDLVSLRDTDTPDDAVCQPCYLTNLAGGYPCLCPTVAPLVPHVDGIRALRALNRERWPLTHGDPSPYPPNPGDDSWPPHANT